MRSYFRPIATLLMAVGVATCSDAPSGPLRHPVTAPDNGTGSGPIIGRGRLAMQPVFSKTALAAAEHLADFGIDFSQVRVVIVRPLADTVKDTTVKFIPGQGDVTLDFTVDVKSPSEVFTGVMDYRSLSGIVFHGETHVQAHAPDQPAPPQAQLLIEYVGPGSKATRISVSPKTANITAPGLATFGVTASDASGAPVAGVPVNWSTSDASVATISTSGVLQATGKRGTVTVTAVTPTNLSDVASATISLPAAGMSLVSGGGQSGKVGTSLGASAVVRVAASDGVGIAGVSVNFAAPAGGAVGASSATTDANGTAASSLKLGTLAGPQSFAAAAGAFSVSIPATATPGDPAAIAAVSGGGQSDTLKHSLKNPLVAKVTDQFSNPVPNVAVGWSKSGSGSLGGASSTTNAEGLASMGYTLGATIGSETITASAGGGTATFTVQAVAGAPSAIAAVSGTGQTGRVTEALLAPFVVHVTDDAGNAVGGATVSWSATNGTLAASTTTDAGGNTSNTLKLGVALGPATASASIANGKIASFGATAIPGIVAKLAIRTGAPNGVAGAALAPAIQIELQDAVGNLTTAANAVTVALGTNPGSATLSGTLTRNAVSGIATFDDLKLDKVGAGYTLSLASAGVPVVTTAAFNVTVGNPTGIQILAGGGQIGTVNSAALTAPSVKLTDANNNPLIGTAVTFTPVGGSGSVLPVAPVLTNAQGIATLTSWTFGTAAGPQSLTVSAPGVASITINAAAKGGAASKLAVLTQPSSSATSGVALAAQPVIQFQDQFGNPVGVHSVVIVSAAPSTGTVSGASVAVDTATGRAAFTGLTINASGNVSLTFSATGVTSVTSSAIALSNTVPTQLLLVPTSPASFSYEAGATPTTPPSLKVADAGGAGVANIPVRVVATVVSNNATITVQDLSLTSDANGLVSFTGTLPTFTGTYTLTATSVAVPSASVAISVAITPAAATQLRMALAPSPTATTGSFLSAQPVVRVTDVYGNLVGGAARSVTVRATGATLTGTTTASTNSSGFAAFLGLGFSSSGTATLIFESAGLQSVTSSAIVVSNSTAAVGGLSVSTQPPSEVANNATFADTKVQLLDQTNSPLARSGIVVTATVDQRNANRTSSIRAPGAAQLNGPRPPGPSNFTSGSEWESAWMGSVLPALFAGTSLVVTATTDANGIATFTGLHFLGIAQTVSLKFSVSSPSFSVWSNDVELKAGAPTTMVASATRSTGTVTTSTLVNATVGAGVYPSVDILDISGNTVPNATTSVAYTVPLGSCTTSYSSTANSSGAVALTSSSANIPNTSVGSCRIRATSTPALTGSPLDFNIIIATNESQGAGITWLGGSSDNFGTGSNWRGGSAPGSSDEIYVPAAVLFKPKLTADRTVGTTKLESGATLDVNGHVLSINGNVEAGTTLTPVIGQGIASTAANGSVKLTAPGAATIRGLLPAMTIGGASCGSFTLSGSVLAAGSVVLACPMDLGRNTFQTFSSGDFSVQGANAKLIMTTAGTSTLTSGALVVARDVLFDGASEVGSLTDGYLSVGRNFNQAHTYSTSSFAGTTNNFEVGFDATSGTQAVTLADPEDSYFANILVSHSTNFNTRVGVRAAFSTAGSGTVASFVATDSLNVVVVGANSTLKFSSNSKPTGSFAVQSGATVTSSGSPVTLTIRDALTAAATADMHGVNVSITGTTFPAFSGLTAATGPATTTIASTAAITLATGTYGVPGNLSVSGTLDLGANTLTVYGDFDVSGSGAELTMASSASKLTVKGNASFSGRTASTGISLGTLEVAGNFREFNNNGGGEFSPGAGFTVSFNGTAAQTVNFDAPGNSSNHSFLTNVLVTNAAGVTQVSPVTSTGTMTIASGNLSVPAVWNVNGQTLSTNTLLIKHSGQLSLGLSSIVTSASCTAFGLANILNGTFACTIDPLNSLVIGSRAPATPRWLGGTR